MMSKNATSNPSKPKKDISEVLDTMMKIKMMQSMNQKPEKNEQRPMYEQFPMYEPPDNTALIVGIIAFVVFILIVTLIILPVGFPCQTYDMYSICSDCPDTQILKDGKCVCDVNQILKNTKCVCKPGFSGSGTPLKCIAILANQTTPGQTTPGQTTPGQTTPGQITPGQTTVEYGPVISGYPPGYSEIESRDW